MIEKHTHPAICTDAAVSEDILLGKTNFSACQNLQEMVLSTVTPTVCVRLVVEAERPPHPSFLLEVCDHDDYSNVLLPDHSPEVFPTCSERPLSCDVRPCSLITLQRKTRKPWIYIYI